MRLPLPQPLGRGRRSLLALAASALLAPGLVACSGDDGGGGGDDDRTADEVLAAAKEHFDQSDGVHISLSTDDLPEGVDGLTGAEGVGTHAPAFDGEIVVAYGGFEPEVPVIAVDDVVYAQLPLTTGWQEIDPAEYGAPDPADLMSTETGFSALLTAMDSVEEGESVRGGENNDEVLTEYTGTVPGDAVQHIIPTASGDFEASFTITDDDELREAVLTGVFYADTEPMTYSIGFTDYGTEQEITAP